MLYAAEALVKIVDQGFWFAPDTYMDSGWNQFDFLLVCGTLVSLFESRLGDAVPRAEGVQVLPAAPRDEELQGRSAVDAHHARGHSPASRCAHFPVLVHAGRVNHRDDAIRR